VPLVINAKSLHQLRTPSKNRRCNIVQQQGHCLRLQLSIIHCQPQCRDHHCLFKLAMQTIQNTHIVIQLEHIVFMTHRTKCRGEGPINHSFVHSLTHSPTHSFIHWPAHSLTHSLTHSCICSFCYSAHVFPHYWVCTYLRSTLSLLTFQVQSFFPGHLTRCLT